MFNKVHNKILQFAIVTGLLLLGAALVTGCGKKPVTVTFDAKAGTFDAAKAKAAKFTAVGKDNKKVTVVVQPDKTGKTPATDILTAPTGKTFKQWNSLEAPTDTKKGSFKSADTDFSPWNDFSVKPTATTLTLYAIWDPKAKEEVAKKDVTVTFDANGGKFKDTVSGLTLATNKETGTLVVKADKTGKTPATDTLTPPTGKTLKEWRSDKNETKGKAKNAATDFSPWTDFDVKDTETTLTLYAIWQ